MLNKGSLDDFSEGLRLLETARNTVKEIEGADPYLVERREQIEVKYRRARKVHYLRQHELHKLAVKDT